MAVDVATRAQAVAPEAAEAAAELFERYRVQLLAFCRRELGSRDEAEDAVQATFVNALRALRRGESPRSETAWLYTIAHNVCRQRLRARMRRGRVELVGEAAERETLAAPTPERRGDELFGLRDAFESMPLRQREAILLREWRGLSYEEIGARLGLSQSAVETLLFRARRTLAQGLEKPSRARRLRKAFDLSWIGGALKGLFGGGAAMKSAATVAVVVAAAGAGGASPTPPSAPERAVVSGSEPALRIAGAATTPRASTPAATRVAPDGTRAAALTATAGGVVLEPVAADSTAAASEPNRAAAAGSPHSIAPATQPARAGVPGVPPAPVEVPVSGPVAVPPVPGVPTSGLPLPEMPDLPSLPEVPPLEPPPVELPPLPPPPQLG